MNALTKESVFMNLDLLPFAMKAKRKEDKIWDPTREKWLVSEPEEIVRQGLIQYLHDQQGIGFSRMRSEWGFMYNQLPKRLDLLVFDKKGQPILIAECKSWKVALSEETLHQVGTYNTVIKAPFAIVCNGLEAALITIDHTLAKAEFTDHWPDLNN